MSLPIFSFFHLNTQDLIACEVLSGMTTGAGIVRGYVLQLVWLAVLLVVCRLIWLAGVRRYVAIGG
jgi:ABC-type uncharacterized transport system permease subunit